MLGSLITRFCYLIGFLFYLHLAFLSLRRNGMIDPECFLACGVLPVAYGKNSLLSALVSGQPLLQIYAFASHGFSYRPDGDHLDHSIP